MPPRSDADTAPADAPVASGWTRTDVSVRLRRGAGGVTRVDGVLCSAPVWVRWDGATLWLVGSGASPVGEDHVRVEVDLGPGVTVAVRSVAATMVYAARGAGTRWDTTLRVADGATLDWRPEPVILTERARHDARTTIHASGGADVLLDDVLVLGRDGERAGLLRSTLDVRVDDVPVLLTSVDTSLPGWAGPAGVAHASVVAHRVRVGGPDVEPATHRDVVVLDPAPGCRLAVAPAADVAAARRAIDAVLPA